VAGLDGQCLAVAAGDALPVQDMEEFVCVGMLVWRRGAAGLEDFDHKDVVDRVRFLVEQHHEVIGILWRNPKRPCVSNVCGAECHAKLLQSPARYGLSNAVSATTRASG